MKGDLRRYDAAILKYKFIDDARPRNGSALD